jgi:hypothetical protein
MAHEPVADSRSGGGRGQAPLSGAGAVPERSTPQRVDVIAAIATAGGRAGIGVIRVSGPDVSRIVAGVIGRELEARRASFATF